MVRPTFAFVQRHLGVDIALNYPTLIFPLLPYGVILLNHLYRWYHIMFRKMKDSLWNGSDLISWGYLSSDLNAVINLEAILKSLRRTGEAGNGRDGHQGWDHEWHTAMDTWGSVLLDSSRTFLRVVTLRSRVWGLFIHQLWYSLIGAFCSWHKLPSISGLPWQWATCDLVAIGNLHAQGCLCLLCDVTSLGRRWEPRAWNGASMTLTPRDFWKERPYICLYLYSAFWLLLLWMS